MRIAQIVCIFPPYFGGMGNSVFHLATNLYKLNQSVTVFTPQYYPEQEKVFDTELVKKIPVDLERQLQFVRRLEPSVKYGFAARLGQLKEELKKFDLVHLHYPFFGTALLIKKWKQQNPNIPLVITYHMDNFASGWKGLIFNLYSYFFLKPILNSADLLIGSTLDFIQHSQANVIYRKKPDKWRELPFGVEINRFKPMTKKKYLFKKYNLDPNKPTFLFVGGMDTAHYFKGVPVFLKSLVYLSAQKKYSWQAILVGDGDLRPKFETLNKSFGLSDRVKFVGKISNEELPDYYNLGDCLVFPSINFNEAFGLVLLEAMASGLFLITSNLPGVRQVAKSCEFSLFFKPNDYQDLAHQLYKYLDEFYIQRDLIKKTNSFQAQQNYSWLEITKKLLSYYQELV